MLPGSSTFNMPGERDQLCRLAPPGISNQPGVQGEAGVHWLSNAFKNILVQEGVQNAGSGASLGSNPDPLLPIPEKVLTLCFRLPVETHLLRVS